MTRFIMLFLTLGLSIGSLGCRMCGSSYDYCMPAYLQRENDYRGCDPLYRSGSVFYGQDAFTVDDNGVRWVADRSINAGNFGKTYPIGSHGKQQGPTSLDPRRGESRIGMPEQEPNGEGEQDYRIPTIEDLMKGNYQDPQSTIRPEGPIEPNRPAIPLTPPNREVPMQEVPMETLPFVSPQNEEPNITLEELRRLDPNVTDIKILNIDDARIEATRPLDPPSVR